MFGEKPIVGKTILRVSNDRIVLPSFTCAETGDQVSATLDVYQKKIILLQEKELIDRLTALQQRMKIARADGRLGLKEYHDLQRYILGTLPLHERIIGKRLEYQLFNRKSVARLELKRIERLLNLRDEVFVVGVGATLEIYPDEKAYSEYQAMEERCLLKLPK